MKAALLILLIGALSYSPGEDRPYIKITPTGGVYELEIHDLSDEEICFILEGINYHKCQP